MDLCRGEQRAGLSVVTRGRKRTPRLPRESTVCADRWCSTQRQHRCVTDAMMRRARPTHHPATMPQPPKHPCDRRQKGSHLCSAPPACPSTRPQPTQPQPHSLPSPPTTTLSFRVHLRSASCRPAAVAAALLPVPLLLASPLLLACAAAAAAAAAAASGGLPVRCPAAVVARCVWVLRLRPPPPCHQFPTGGPSPSQALP
eukprot:COSAG02_NODE_177_length_31154_cov_32.205152_16_plen_200_part_00